MNRGVAPGQKTGKKSLKKDPDKIVESIIARRKKVSAP
jgi:hypothetical protein